MKQFPLKEYKQHAKRHNGFISKKMLKKTFEHIEYLEKLTRIICEYEGEVETFTDSVEKYMGIAGWHLWIK